jgi:predicted metal-dependent enzyme (double-stranded beta helix superfamily)
MRWAAAALLSVLVQSATAPATLPPPYPRTGATKILDNDRVQVWNIAWLKGQPSPLHRHIYDLVGVYYEPGDRMIISPEGAKRPVSTKAWDIAFQRVGVTHVEEGTSDAPLRSVFVEMKQAGPYGTDAATSSAPVFSGAGGTQKLDNDRVTVWEYTQTPAAKPHRHTRDAVVVAINGQNPRAVWVKRGTEHSDEGAGSASRVYVFEIK